MKMMDDPLLTHLGARTSTMSCLTSFTAWNYSVSVLLTCTYNCIYCSKPETILFLCRWLVPITAYCSKPETILFLCCCLDRMLFFYIYNSCMVFSYICISIIHILTGFTPYCYLFPIILWITTTISHNQSIIFCNLFQGQRGVYKWTCCCFSFTDM